MRRKRWIEGLIACISMVLCFLWGNPGIATAQQQPAGQPASRAVASLAIVNVEGDAQILTKADLEKSRGEARILTQAWKPAVPKTTLSPGDQLQTGARGAIQLQLNDGTLVTLAGDSVITVEQLRSARGQTSQLTQLKLEKGKISTQQTTRILGQTNQVIRTDNGSVNTRLGEVEVWKPVQEPQKYVMLAGLTSQLPRLAQKAPKDDTFVSLNRGTAVIQSSGKGRMIANSLMDLETCMAHDGIKFMLQNPNVEVTVSRLEEENGFRLTSKEDFHLLVGTEGSSNQVNVATKNDDALIDIEGVEVAEQNENSRSIIILHPLLTVGVKSSDLLVNLLCDPTESRGINEFDIMGDGVFASRKTIGEDTNRTDPSRGLVSRPTPVGPTPTPTPTPEGPIPTPTPTEVPRDTPTPGPTPIPVTHTFPRNPAISNVVANIVSAGMCGGPASREVRVRFDFVNHLPQIMPGLLTSYITDITWTPYAYVERRIAEDIVLIGYSYSNDNQRETGTIIYTFCYIQPPANNDLRFQFFIQDREGNPSQMPRCSGTIGIPPTSTLITCN